MPIERSNQVRWAGAVHAAIARFGPGIAVRCLSLNRPAAEERPLPARICVRAGLARCIVRGGGGDGAWMHWQAETVWSKGDSAGPPSPEVLVFFEFVEGAAPDEVGDLSTGFEALGAMAARCHVQTLGWARRDVFERLTWDLEAIFGLTPSWGDWRDAPDAVRPVLERVEAKLRAHLTA